MTNTVHSPIKARHCEERSDAAIWLGPDEKTVAAISPASYLQGQARLPRLVYTRLAMTGELEALRYAKLRSTFKDKPVHKFLNTKLDKAEYE